MLLIPVGQRGYKAKVDVEDFALVAPHRWWIAKSGRQIYARTRINGKHKFMHTLIAGYGIDHANGDGLDNRKQNLRPATKSQNAANIRPHRDNKCGIKGIWWNDRDKRWQAQICKEGKKRHLGNFKSAAAAARAYKLAAKQAFGVFAYGHQGI